MSNYWVNNKSISDHGLENFAWRSSQGSDDAFIYLIAAEAVNVSCSVVQ